MYLPELVHHRKKAKTVEREGLASPAEIGVVGCP
jgi:hypothetical protein